jgi:acylphosphatase
MPTSDTTASAAPVRVQLRVEGLVQGVYYRASAQRTAVQLGLVGWVRNTEDGAVELQAQGPRAAVAALVAWCRRGPPAARVDEISQAEIPVVEGESSFAIHR